MGHARNVKVMGLTKRNKRVILCVEDGRAVCPRCGRRTNLRIQPNTVLKNFPLYCKWCRAVTIVSTEE